MVARGDRDSGEANIGSTSIKAGLRRSIETLSICVPRSSLKNLSALWMTWNGPSLIAEVEYDGDGHGVGRKLCGRL